MMKAGYGGPSAQDIINLAAVMGSLWESTSSVIDAATVASAKPTQKMFVGGLPKVCTEDMIRESLELFGPILEARIMFNEVGESKGYAFVTFAQLEDAKKVYANYDNNMIAGKWVDCKPISLSSAAGTGLPPVPKSGDWICPACGDLVFAWRDACNMCGHSAAGALPAVAAAPPAGVPAIAVKGKGGRPGDWICPDCGDLVFSSRDKCNKCGKNKPVELARIGMKVGDWMCPGCGDLVFASKGACSMCGTTKPADGISSGGLKLPGRGVSPY
jgi:uncharacterized OB-fold protein